MRDGWVSYAHRIHAILIHGNVRPGHAKVNFIKLLGDEQLCGDVESDHHANLPASGCPRCKAVV